jgi:hypothetical protein
MSIFARLNYSFANTQYNGADQLTPGVLNLLNNQPQNLNQWQINDIANASASGYFQNPHNNNLGTLAVFVTGILSLSNTSYCDYNVNSEAANTMFAQAGLAQSTLTGFTTHTNNLSGVTRSTNTSQYPDLNSALNIGRQILTITNKSDGVQNNIPIIGNFSSLYIGNTLTNITSTIANDFIILNNSITANNGNLSSNLSNSQINTIANDLSNLQINMSTAKNNDITFYQNSYAVYNDYNTVTQFNHLGSTQNNLITLIGTSKLKTDLNYGN